ncbi:hypothetical protein [Cupriavidus sp. Marseille-Q8015]
MHTTNANSNLPLAGITGRRVLGIAGIAPATLGIDGSHLAERPAEAGPCIDAGDLLVLPGIVDIHGDAFERSVMPRPGVSFPYPVALLDVDRQLLSHGITTEFHGVTLSWEGGLRGAWHLVSRNPARAAGLRDRGALVPGMRADAILVDDSQPGMPRVCAAIVGGRVCHATMALPMVDLATVAVLGAARGTSLAA